MGMREWFGVGGTSDGTPTGTASLLKVVSGVASTISTTSDALLTTIAGRLLDSGSVSAAENLKTIAARLLDSGSVTVANLLKKIADEVTVGAGLLVRQPTPGNLNCTEASASSIKTAVELVDDAIGTTDAAAPTKSMQAGGRAYLNPASLPAAVADGDSIPLSCSQQGELFVYLSRPIAGEDTAIHKLVVEQRYAPFGGEQSASATLKTGAGFCHNLWMNCTAAGTILIRDATADGAGTLLATITCGAAEFLGPSKLPGNFTFSTGLRITISSGTWTFNGVGR